MSNEQPEKPKKQEKPKSEEVAEPSVTLSLEETTLIIDGLNGLPIDRKKTVVFDRLMMKLTKADGYWQKIEKIRQSRRDEVAQKLLEERPS